MSLENVINENHISSLEMFVDGEFISSDEESEFEVRNPYTNEVFATVPEGSEKDVDLAVDAADNTFKNEWEGVLPSERSAILHDIAEVIETNSEQLTQIETLQSARPIRDQSSITQSVKSIYKYYAGLCETIEGTVPPAENKSGQILNYTTKEPYGVVGSITPWNAPFLLSAYKLAPALATGNTVVEKPSEHTPVTSLVFADLIHNNTDIPDGVYNVVPGFGDTGSALTRNSKVDKLTFTGSKEVGQEIAKNGGENVTPVTLELGGKSPNIIFESADLDNSVIGAIKGIFLASGQGCVAGSRILVHEPIYEEFLERFINRAKSITLGDPLDPETEMGPIASAEQFEKVMKYIKIGVEEGANLEYGGEEVKTSEGNHLIQPTVFANVDNSMRIAQDEIFGPVAAIISFSDESHAVEIANDTEYGLAAGIWTGDIAQAHSVARQIDAGTVWINEYRTGSYVAPSGGYKKSGIGRENGKESLREYLQTKSIYVDLEGEISDPFKLG